MKVELLDGMVRAFLLDDSLPVQELAEEIGKKLFLRNPEEFSLQWRETGGGEDSRKQGKKKKKNKQFDDFWLNPQQALGEQGVPDDAVLLLVKKYFDDDKNLDTSDPSQLHLIYVQVL